MIHLKAWFATGTPSYLVYLLQKHHYNLEQMEHVETTEAVLDCIDPDSTNPIPIIYQSGYLTIKNYDREFGIYSLGYPNKEVEEGFVEYLMPFYTNADKIILRLQSFFDDTPYEQRNIERWIVKE